MATQWDLIEGHLMLLTNVSSTPGKSVPGGLIGQIRISEQSFSYSPVRLQGLNSPLWQWKDVADHTM